MKPTLGCLIHVHLPTAWNGSHEAPAFVTRVWGDTDPALSNGSFICVNATVLPDLGGALGFGSIALYATRAEAEASGQTLYAWFPEEGV